MYWKYSGLTDQESELIYECTQIPPNFEKIKALMQQVNINASTDDPVGEKEYLLSEVIGSYPYCPAEIGCPKEVEFCDRCPQYQKIEKDAVTYFPQIISLFIENGFDVSQHDYLAGYECFNSLYYTRFQEGGIDARLSAAKQLLDAGAKSKLTFEDSMGRESVSEFALDRIMCPGHPDFITAEDYQKNVNEHMAFFHLYEAAEEGKNYRDIQHYQHCIGRRIDDVTLCAENDVLQGISPYISADSTEHSNSFNDHIVLWCEGLPLCVDRNTVLWVDPNIPETAAESASLRELFAECLGAVITDIEFGGRCSNRLPERYAPYTYIRLDNGKTIFLRSNYGEAKQYQDIVAYFDILPTEECPVKEIDLR